MSENEISDIIYVGNHKYVGRCRKMSERMSEKAGIVPRTIQRDLAELQTKGIIIREGGRKEGKWVIINKE